jgi:hypothetical protein
VNEKPDGLIVDHDATTRDSMAALAVEIQFASRCQ